MPYIHCIDSKKQNQSGKFLFFLLLSNLLLKAIIGSVMNQTQLFSRFFETI